MNIDLTKTIYDKMASHQFVMAVMGNFNQDLLKSLIQMAERKLDSLEKDDSIKKKIFHFMVECAQNLCKIENDRDNTGKKLFLIGKQAENYVIHIGAVFSLARVEKMKSIIDAVNRLGYSEVKQQFYNELSGKQLANQDHLLMSLLDLAKRTKEKIYYEVSPVDSLNSFLSFKASVTGVRQ